MSIKYILHGGLYHDRPNNNIRAFGEDIIKNARKDSAKILLCTFARPKEQWHTFFEKDRDSFLVHFPDLQFTLANPEIFVEQARDSDVIYLRGGDTQMILDTMQNIDGWKEILQGKIVVGESAGAQFFSKYYFGLKSLQIEEGFGLLPIKVIVHWDSDYNAPHIDWMKAESELNNYEEDLPVYKLKEGEFMVIEK
jgi:peptidase E